MATTNSNPHGMMIPGTSVNRTDLRSAPSNPTNALYPQGIPEPPGTTSPEEQRAETGANTDPTLGEGVEGEVTVWEARYSNKNFIGRLATRILLTLVGAGLALYTWAFGHPGLAPLAWAGLVVVAVFWAALLYRMIQAHLSHFYQLTNRRLFVSTGVINRRRDMMELLRVKDVYTSQQSLLERWLGVGTVTVVPSEKDLPTFYLTGVTDPKEVMDLVWHHARAERDQRSLKVENV
jgi:membrane protein YdbS with pleckstrin-like domain